jgi:formate dehydrogenase maturation protein FdhE
MNTKEYIKRVMEENNKELKKYFQSLLSDATDSLKQYINTQIDNIPEVQTYTKAEIQAMIQEMIDNYDIEYNTNFRTNDNKLIVTADGKIFYGK